MAQHRTHGKWALISALTLQVYKFYVCFPKEHARIKVLVYLVFLLQLAQTAIMSHFAYTILVLRWGEPNAFNFPWSGFISPISGGLTSAIVQIFFARRIFILKGDKMWACVVAGIIVLLSLMQSLAGIINVAIFAAFTTEVSELKHFATGVKVWYIGSAVCDIVITMTMTFILNDYRSKIPWKTTDTLLNKLIFNTIETGAATTFVAIVGVVLSILFPATYLGQLQAYTHGPVYAIVIVASLNARADLTPGSVAVTPYGGEISWGRPGGTTDQEAPQTVHITTHATTQASLIYFGQVPF
ncbi:hypothetical protein K438DRAFT_1974553 [Mycena galopus ATCC 62051]|nr:hypothetical protein K438DRAFT_1974553 [Mycena galopus ATCC 62051]